MLCSFSTLVDDNVTCGISPEYQVQSECVPLAKCERDVTTHLEMYGISDDPFILKSEMKLLLARAGKVIVSCFLSVLLLYSAYITLVL